MSRPQAPGESTVGRVKPKRSRRRFLWVLGFSFGFVPLIPLIFATLLSLEYLPWLIVSGSLTFVSGYEIWQEDHPGENARRRARNLIVRSVAFLVGAAALIFGREYPAIIVGGIALVLVLLVALSIVLWSLERGVRRRSAVSLGDSAAMRTTSGDRDIPL